MTEVIMKAQDTVGEDALDELTAALEAGNKSGDEKAEEKEDELSTSTETKTDGEEESKEGAEGEGTEEEQNAEDGVETGKEKEVEGVERDVELAELRSLLRDQKRESSLLKQRLARVDKRTSKVIDEETGEEKDIEEDLTPIENLMTEKEGVIVARGGQLDVLLQQMSETKKWEDVGIVVSTSRFNDVVDTIAEHVAKEQGGNFEERRLEVEISIWKMSNPYKYMYDIIKKYHPDFTEKEGSEAETKTETKTAEKKVKEPVKETTSIGNLKGGGDKGGWTAARIDKMDEDELDKVPKDVYDKYLRNELD
jgi:hypothetical protein